MYPRLTTGHDSRYLSAYVLRLDTLEHSRYIILIFFTEG